MIGKLHVNIRVSWWVKHYVMLLILFCKLFNTYPDMKKLERVLSRGIRIEDMK